MNIFLLIDLGLFVGLYAIYYILRLRRQPPARRLIKTLFFAYAALLLLLTVSPMQMIAAGRVSVSLHDINRAAFQYNLDREIIGNILLFLPLGFLLPLAYPKLKDWTILIAILTSIAIELLQQSIGRVSDTTDVINNSLGSIIGFYLALPLVYWLSRGKRRLKRGDHETTD